MLYSFFWAITRCLKFMCRRFRTLCSIFIGRVSRTNNRDKNGFTLLSTCFTKSTCFFPPVRDGSGLGVSVSASVSTVCVCVCVLSRLLHIAARTGCSAFPPTNTWLDPYFLLFKKMRPTSKLSALYVNPR